MKFTTRALIILFCQSFYSQQIFHSEYYNSKSAYESFSDLNTYKTFTQLTLFEDNLLNWQSEVFFYDKKGNKKRVRCLEKKGNWIKNDSLFIFNIDNLIMRFYSSKKGKRLFNLDEDPKFRKKNSLKKVKKRKKFICNQDGGEL